jgi:hypothetical protein
MLKEEKYFGSLRGVKDKKGNPSLTLFHWRHIVFHLWINHWYKKFKLILDLYCMATTLEINFDKSCLTLHQLSTHKLGMIMDIIPTPRYNLDNIFKYFGCFFKLDNYIFVNWEWLVKNI